MPGQRSEEPQQVDQVVDGLLATLGNTADAMIAVDDDLKIIGWNDAATQLFGLTEKEALGQPCSAVMCWRDRAGNPVCEDCGVEHPWNDGQPRPTREILGRKADGKSLWLSATTLLPPEEVRAECALVHLVREVSLPPELERLVAERLGGEAQTAAQEPTVLDRLTGREAEVLELLTEGLDGSAIADKLYLSHATVRNHIQHILSKLEVHSRTEAVALALRGGRPAR